MQSNQNMVIKGANESHCLTSTQSNKKAIMKGETNELLDKPVDQNTVVIPVVDRHP
jgi:hypothetical protein